jgi:transposase
MYIASVPNRNSRPAILLREGYREDGKVKNRTIANLTDWPLEQIEGLRRLLKGEKLFSVDDAFEKISSLHHGHVRAVLCAMDQLGFKKLIASRPSRERDIVTAMVAWRIIRPASKLSMQRTWKDTTLPDLLGIRNVNEDDLYNAMDWLVTRQDQIEKKLAKRHFTKNGLVLYDLSSSYFEGTKCPLAKLGYNRDGLRGKLQVNYGLLTDERGCPVSISVFEGNTGDPDTLLPAVSKTRERFGVNELVLVGDRGMISQKQIDTLEKLNGIAWITALRNGAIRELVEGKTIQLGLFDEKNLFEIKHPDYPGERLVACRNPDLARLRAHKRQSLIEATTKRLDKIRSMVMKGRIKLAEAIALRVGKAIDKFKVGKHFILDIQQGIFNFQVDQKNVEAEAALDGIYVIRTKLNKESMSTNDVVRSYKKLSQVERAFRSLKTIDLKIRPIYHHDENRVRAHIFLCMLAYYVEWHMKEVLRPLLFSDEDQDFKKTRDPVAPAKRSNSALKKIASKETTEGFEVHSFRTLIEHLGGIVRNFCKRKNSNLSETITIIETTPDPIQQRAFELIRGIRV